MWRALPLLLLTPFLLAQPPARPATPSDAVLAVAADLARLPKSLRRTARYLDLSHHPTRADLSGVLSGHINGMSKESEVRVPVFVEGTDWLVRFDLGDYAIDPKVYEGLANADPHYHVRVRVPWPGGAYKGVAYPRGSFNVVQAAFAPYLAETPQAQAALAFCVRETGSSAFLLRGAWFFNQTAAMEGRTPNYADLLGYKDEKGFQRLVGFIPGASRRVELLEAVSDSGVSEQPRGIRRDECVGGAYWRTRDFAKAVDRENPLRVLGEDIERGFRQSKKAASEQYGHLPNDLLAMALFDNKGVRQNSAPDFVGKDSKSGSNDGRIHNPVSCLRCHVEGLRPVDGWHRNLYLPPSPLELKAVDPFATRRLRQQYLRRLETFLERDNRQYAHALLQATGWTPRDYAGKVAREWEWYEDARVDLAWAERDLGVAPGTLKAALQRQLQAVGKVDTVLGGFLLEGKRRVTMGIRQWEEVYPLAQLVIRGLEAR